MVFRGTYAVALALAITPAMVGARDRSGDQPTGDSPDHSVAASVIGNPGTWFGRSTYPAEAILKKEQGRTVAQIDVDAKGAPSHCSVTVSSGSTSLDARTCEIAIASLRFNPARDRSGTPISSSYVLPVRWVLPSQEEIDVSGGRHILVDTTAQFDIDAHGIITACHTVRLTPGTPDPCADFHPGGLSPQQPVAHGKPVAGRATSIVQTYMEPQ